MIPTDILGEIIREWMVDFGPTYPLYGKETVRHDISGSIRPLLSSTEIPHATILAERCGMSKRAIQRILSGETKTVSFDIADRIITAIDRNDVWYVELSDYA